MSEEHDSRLPAEEFRGFTFETQRDELIDVDAAEFKECVGEAYRAGFDLVGFEVRTEFDSEEN